MNTIKTVSARRFRVPLSEVLSDAKHGDHTHFELVTVNVRLADGSEGTGYTYTGGRGGHAIVAMITHDLAPYLRGRDATAVEEMHDALQWHIHYVGRGGIAAFAISAVDIADWRLRTFALYATVRQIAADDPAEAHSYWRQERDRMFGTHPASPLPAAAKATFGGLKTADTQPNARLHHPPPQPAAGRAPSTRTGEQDRAGANGSVRGDSALGVEEDRLVTGRDHQRIGMNAPVGVHRERSLDVGVMRSDEIGSGPHPYVQAAAEEH